MQARFRKSFAGSISTAWLILCMLFYLYVSRIGFVQIVDLTHGKPFVDMLVHISPGDYLLDLIAAILGILLFSLACLSLGFFTLSKWELPAPSNLAFGVTAFLTGEILFSLLFLTLIRLYQFTPVISGLSLLAGFLIGLPASKRFLTGLRIEPRFSTGFNSSERAVLLLILALLALSLLLSATRLGYDATADYFSHAKIMAVSQSPVFFHPNYSFIVSEFHPGILFAALIQVFGDQSARLLSWVNGLAILLLAAAIGRVLGLTRQGELWFLALAVSSTAFVDLLGDGKVELISTAPILAAIYWLLLGAKNPSRGTFLLIGILAGFAIISRPYNLFLVSFFIALFLICQAFILYRSGRFAFTTFLRPLLWMLPTLFFMGVFHLFQNWLWLTDPLAPLTLAKEMNSADWQWVVDPAHLTVYRLFYPLTLTFLNSQQSIGNISPLLVGFLPFLLLKGVRRDFHLSPLAKQLLLVAGLTLVAWITISFTVLEIRYVLFLWIIVFLAAAKILESTIQHAEIPLLRPLLIAFLGVLCLRTFMIAIVTYFPQDSAQEPYCPDSNLCKFMSTLNKTAAPGDRVFVLHAYRYYLRPDLFACSSQQQEYYPLQDLARQNSAEFWTELQRLGFHYIMFEQHLSEQRYHFGKLPSLDTVPDSMDVRVLYSNPGATQVIYELETNHPTTKVSCVEDSKRIWKLIPATIEP